MEPPSNGRISVINNSGRRLQIAPLRRAVQLALSSHPSQRTSVCILLTTDEEVQDLNCRFRGIDQPTDVLSFPAHEIASETLGDIAISVPFAERQSHLRKISVGAELQYLAIHGTLHLLGFDDESPEDRLVMLGRMSEIGEAAGLPPEPEWSSLLHEVGP